MATNLPPYLEKGLAAIAYGERQQMERWQEEHDPEGYYPTANAEGMRIHIARRLLVLAETGRGAGLFTPTITVVPRRVHGHKEGCECSECRDMQEALGRSDKLLRPVEAF